MSEAMNVYDRIRLIMKKRGITPYRFAKMVGTYPSVVYAWLEKGGQPGYNISKPKIQQIVDAFAKDGVTIDWLERGFGPEPEFKASESDYAPADEDVGVVVSHLDNALAALRAGRVIDAFEAVEAARHSLAA